MGIVVVMEKLLVFQQSEIYNRAYGFPYQSGQMLISLGLALYGHFHGFMELLFCFVPPKLTAIHKLFLALSISQSSAKQSNYRNRKSDKQKHLVVYLWLCEYYCQLQ